MKSDYASPHLDPEREALLLYQGVFANVQDGLVILDMTASSPRIVDINQAARVVSRDGATDFKGASVKDYFSGLFGEEFEKACRQSVQSRKPLDFGEVRGAGAAIYRVQLFPLFDDYLGVMLSDTTERKQTEVALLSLRNLSSSLHSSADIELILERVVRETMLIVGAENGLIALCSADGISSFRYFRNGQLVACEDGGTAATGIPGRLIYQTQSYLCNDVLHDPQIDRELAIVNGVRNVVSTPILETDGAMIGYLEIQNKKEPSGFTSFDLEQLTTVAQIAAQAVQNAKDFRKISQDAAELERRVAERTAQLQELNEELDAFAHSVSHDLRSPLRAILTFTEILQENQHKASDPERGDFLRRISAAGQNMDRLIQDLLSYSHLSRQEILLQTVDLNQVVAEAAGQLKLEEQGVSFRLEQAGALPTVKGNHQVLVQVVWNILSNAVKYVPEGVTPSLRIWSEQERDRVRLLVKDNGIGIAPENKERIFGVFERLHGIETYPGTGIGLAIARKAVTRLGGRIGVESKLGMGSTFWIELLGAGKRLSERNINHA
jgi:signal transduction histidine kinase